MPKDFLNGDHSFKNWFRIMWKNGYIQLFPVGIGFIFLSWWIRYSAYWIDVPFTDWQINGAWFPLFVGLLMTYLIVYKGFYQFWYDLKNGRSR